MDIKSKHTTETLFEKMKFVNELIIGIARI